MTSAATSERPDPAKHAAARRALDFVVDGMALGLGTGSTAAIFVDLLADRVADGLKVVGVPTSERTAAQARAKGIPLVTLDDQPALDLTIDGADEFDPFLHLIKGGGGALLREKIVAAASREMVVIADESKAVATLGRFPLPVEVNRFGLGATVRAVSDIVRRHGCAGDIVLRGGQDHPFVTDGGHLILDCHFGRIDTPEALAPELLAIPGVVEHGLFLGIASTIILGHASGGVTILSHHPKVEQKPAEGDFNKTEARPGAQSPASESESR